MTYPCPRSLDESRAALRIKHDVDPYLEYLLIDFVKMAFKIQRRIYFQNTRQRFENLQNDT